MRGSGVRHPTCFRPERVLFRPGAWEPGPPADLATAFGGGRRGCGGLYHRSQRSARRYRCTPPRSPSISLPGRKMPPFRIGNSHVLSGVSGWTTTVLAGKSSRTNNSAAWNRRRLVSRSADILELNNLAHSPAALRLCFSFTSKSQTSYKVSSCRPVALTVRASDSKSGGWGFESLLACQGYQGVSWKAVCLFKVPVHPKSLNSGWNDFGPSLCQIEQFTHGWLSRSHTEKPAYDASEEALKPCSRPAPYKRSHCVMRAIALFILYKNILPKPEWYGTIILY